jgi:hypothetical protein
VLNKAKLKNAIMTIFPQIGISYSIIGFRVRSGINKYKDRIYNIKSDA